VAFISDSCLVVVGARVRSFKKIGPAKFELRAILFKTVGTRLLPSNKLFWIFGVP
jgi:hypothetical protein